MTQPLRQAPASEGAEVRIEPIGATVAVRPGEPLMQAAVRQGLRWPTICRGSALCGACYVRVVDAAEAQDAPGPREVKTLKLVPPHMQGPAVRLACQLVPRGTMQVERAGVARREN